MEESRPNKAFIRDARTGKEWVPENTENIEVKESEAENGTGTSTAKD